jgi:hypothetical protein
MANSLTEPLEIAAWEEYLLARVKASGYSQMAVYQSLSIDPTGWMRIRRGTSLNIKTLQRIADKLNVPRDEMLLMAGLAPRGISRVDAVLALARFHTLQHVHLSLSRQVLRALDGCTEHQQTKLANLLAQFLDSYHVTEDPHA